MYTVRCADAGAFTCKGHARAETMDGLLKQVADHLRTVHNVKTPTATLLNYMAKLAKQV